MTRMVAALAIFALAPACGRLEFAPVPRDSDTDSADDSDVEDATGDAAAACSPGLIVCDLFEAPIDSLRWDISGGTFNLDTTIAHRGASSVRFSIPATPAGTQVGSYIGHTDPAIAAASQLWTRAWVRMSALPTSTNAAELLVVQRSGALGNFVFIRNNDVQLYHQIDLQNGGASVVAPLDTWFCLLWRLTLSTTNTGGSVVTSDVLPTFAISNSITQTSPAMDNVSFGPFFATNNIDEPQPAFDVWIDDVIVDDAPVTCAD